MKILTFALLLLNITHTILSKPVRMRRQIVAPKWLQGPQNLFVDGRVRVSSQNLKEAAAIRASLQQAVQDGTFAVDMNVKNALHMTDSNGTEAEARTQTSEPEPVLINPTTTPPLIPGFTPFWEFQFPSPAPIIVGQSQQNFTPFWEFQFPSPPPIIVGQSQQNFMSDMQRGWTDFVEFTKQMFADWNWN